jgi:hypothetical protein
MDVPFPPRSTGSMLLNPITCLGGSCTKLAVRLVRDSRSLSVDENLSSVSRKLATVARRTRAWNASSTGCKARHEGGKDGRPVRARQARGRSCNTSRHVRQVPYLVELIHRPVDGALHNQILHHKRHEHVGPDEGQGPAAQASHPEARGLAAIGPEGGGGGQGEDRGAEEEVAGAALPEGPPRARRKDGEEAGQRQAHVHDRLELRERERAILGVAQHPRQEARALRGEDSLSHRLTEGRNP